VSDENLPIGVFDSGMGGLTVMRALRARLPGENLLYLGDTARLPYGTKSADTVTRYALSAAHALTARGIKMLVVACNTVSGAALPVIGVIEPGAQAAIAAAHGAPVAIIATEGTVKSGAYVRAIHALAPDLPVVQQAAPLLVPLAEEGLVTGEIARLAVARYLTPLLATVPHPRILVLGCTHFPVLKDTIAQVAGPGVSLVDSAETTARAVEAKLDALGLRNSGANGTSHFLATDAPDRFSRVGEIFLGAPIDPGNVEVIDL
jgi:glutamate racemase